MWIGIASLASLGWGLTLVGVGVITLAGQLTRKSAGLAVEGFWVFVALLFVSSGVWMALGVGSATHAWSIIPLVCIVAGATLFFSALLRRPVDHTGR
jgi:hypothetical protein